MFVPDAAAKPVVALVVELSQLYVKLPFPPEGNDPERLDAKEPEQIV